jgi:hypothetical protein
MTETEKKQLRVLLKEQRKGWERGVRRRQENDPKHLPTWERKIKVRWMTGGRLTEREMTVWEAVDIALSEIAEHAGGCGGAAYEFARRLFSLIPAD